jgi:hypothetical protein
MFNRPETILPVSATSLRPLRPIPAGLTGRPSVTVGAAPAHPPRPRQSVRRSLLRHREGKRLRMVVPGPWPMSSIPCSASACATARSPSRHRRDHLPQAAEFKLAYLDLQKHLTRVFGMIDVPDGLALREAAAIPRVLRDGSYFDDQINGGRSLVSAFWVDTLAPQNQTGLRNQGGMYECHR